MNKAFLLWEVLSGRISILSFRQHYRAGLLDGLLTEELEMFFAEYHFCRFFQAILS